MQVIVKKWGNSAAVRIPCSVLAASGLTIDQAVDVRGEAGRVIIEPVKPKEHDLATLWSGITKENVHEEANYGPAVGHELF